MLRSGDRARRKTAATRARINTAVEDAAAKLIEAGVPDVGDHLAAALKDGGTTVGETFLEETSKLTRQQARVRRSFERRLRRRWRKALDLFEAVYVGALELGGDFNSRLPPDTDFRLEALVRIHARSCMVASETLALLRTGHARGAMGRARTLHEHAVVAFVLKDGTPENAERYLLHEGWESYSRALDYQEHAVPLGYEPFTDEELTEMREQLDRLVQRFGPGFTDQYGWASTMLDPPRRATFREVEELAGLEHLRPYYKWFSDSVHAGSSATASALVERGRRLMYVVGPSDDQLADPASVAMGGLVQVTVALLTAPDPPEPTDVIYLYALMHAADQANEEFLRCHQALEDAEAALATDGPGFHGRVAALVRRGSR